MPLIHRSLLRGWVGARPNCSRNVQMPVEIRNVQYESRETRQKKQRISFLRLEVIDIPAENQTPLTSFRELRLEFYW